MDILSTIVLLAVVFAFAYMALDAGRRAKKYKRGGRMVVSEFTSSPSPSRGEGAIAYYFATWPSA